jgi:hypothetical protein
MLATDMQEKVRFAARPLDDIMPSFEQLAPMPPLANRITENRSPV